MPRSFELDPRTRRVHAVAEDGDCFPFIYYIFRHMTEYIASIWYFKLYTCIHYALCVRNLLHRNLDPMTWCSMCWRQAMSHPGTGPACESTMFRRAARNSICFSANYAPIMHPYDQVFTPRRSAGGGLCAGSTHWGREEGPKNWYSMQEMNALHHAVNWH